MAWETPNGLAAKNESHESNPNAILRARSSSLILVEENCPISRTSRCRGTVKMLSAFTTDGRGDVGNRFRLDLASQGCFDDVSQGTPHRIDWSTDRHP